MKIDVQVVVMCRDPLAEPASYTLVYQTSAGSSYVKDGLSFREADDLMQCFKVTLDAQDAKEKPQ